MTDIRARLRGPARPARDAREAAPVPPTGHRVTRAMRRAGTLYFSPGWIGLHVLAWAAAIVMVFLGRWQLHVSDAKHFDLQNFGYAFQWWAFSAFALLIWARMLRDAWRGGSSQRSTSGELVLRRGEVAPGGGAYVGPAEFRTQPTDGSAPVVYRGYAMPQSTAQLYGSDDQVHGAYNDYLWQLALADEAAARDRARAAPRPGEPPEPRPAIDPDPASD